MKVVTNMVDAGALGTSLDDLTALSAEVVDYFYAQVCAPAECATEAAVCQAFSAMLLRHWDLCCISIFLRPDATTELRERALYTHPHMDAAAARRACVALAASVAPVGRELQVGLDADETAETAAGARLIGEQLVLEELSAGVGIPIHARGELVGVLAAGSAHAERLRTALPGLRFVAAPIVIALANARQAAAMRAQHEHIEHLVEELQQRTGALEEANRELQRVGRYRSLFLARMSHELRTPLTSMLGFCEILLEHEALSPTQRRFCEKIQHSGLQLHTSIKQLVDLSRLEAGHTELFLHEFSVRETLREGCAAVGRLAQKQDVKLDCQTAPELGTIVSDEGKLRQVLYNFLANAVGRSQAGATVEVRAYAHGPERFYIDIRDDGDPLLDPAEVFDPVDVDAPNERGTNMNELGLTVAHRLLDILGGTVGLDASATNGLIVRLDLPRCPQK